MSYENPQIPEGINVGRDSAFSEFLRLLAGAALAIVLLGAALYFAGGWLARQIPFSVERNWAGSERVIGFGKIADGGAQHAATEGYLRELAAQLAVAMAVPQDMTLTLHFADLPEPNAFASLGGHIIVTRGLYERMPSENALALVIAHEIAHIQARDPIAGAAGGSLLMVLTALLTGDTGGLSGAMASLVQRGYSRRAEQTADEAAIAALRSRYGHAGGGAAVFEVFAHYRSEHGGEAPALLSTHPLDADRIAYLRDAAKDWNPQLQPLRPLPALDAQ
ncbi:MAG TPA: M48 family metallopeptidase [Fontimonas sp.]